jgi:transposase
MFSPTQQNYEIYDRELLGIIPALEKWRHYIQGSGHTMIVHSSHKNLTYFRTAQKLNRPQARWSLYLSEFNVKLVHMPGMKMIQSDVLLRPAVCIILWTPRFCSMCHLTWFPQPNKRDNIGYGLIGLKALFLTTPATMPPRLSKDLKSRIVQCQYFEDQLTMRDIATQARCSVGLVHNVLSNFREFGTTVNPFKRYTGRSRYLDEEDMLYLTTLLKANPSLYLDELQLKLADARDVHISTKLCTDQYSKDMVWKTRLAHIGKTEGVIRLSGFKL